MALTLHLEYAGKSARVALQGLQLEKPKLALRNATPVGDVANRRLISGVRRNPQVDFETLIRDDPELDLELAGSEIDAVNAHGWTAAYIATMNESLAALRVLLGAGANVHIRESNGYDALMTAAEGRRPEALDLLLAHGACIGPINVRGENALAIAKRHAEHPSASAEARRVLATLRAVAKSAV